VHRPFALPATLIYLVGERVNLTAPEVAPNGARFTRWVVNGESFPRRTLTLHATQVSRITLVYSPNTPQTKEQFLRSLLAPWRQGQVWLPSTYDAHAGNNPEYAVDFNRLSSARATCPYYNGFLQDCNEPMLASHAGRVYTRAQSGCTGYGNFAVVGQHGAPHRRRQQHLSGDHLRAPELLPRAERVSGRGRRTDWAAW
jgi:hypothetical protein